MSSGWSCGTLLAPILVLAHNGTHVAPLHIFAVTNALAQVFACSIKLPPVLATCVASFGFLVTQCSDLPLLQVVRSAVSAVLLQVSLVIGLGGTFSLGEAAFVSQLVVLTKYLWTAGEWTLLQRVSYVLWASTLLGVLVTASIGSLLPKAQNPLALTASTAAVFAGGLRLMGLGLADLVTLY